MPDFQIIKTLSSGSQGQVVLIQADAKLYALKRINKHAKAFNARRVKNELLAGKLLHHPKIVTVHSHTEDEQFVHIVMDYVSGTDLLSYVMKKGRLEEQHAKQIFLQILEAVLFCHSRGIYHRDLKLENVMYDEQTNKVTLIDFGLCEVHEPGSQEVLQSGDFCGTFEYAPPELLLQLPYISSKVDVWCLGVMLYAMLFGRYPFVSKARQQMTFLDEHPAVIFPHNNTREFPTSVTQNSRDLIQKMLSFEVHSRCTIEDITNHPWLGSAVPPAAAAAAFLGAATTLAAAAASKTQDMFATCVGTAAVAVAAAQGCAPQSS